MFDNTKYNPRSVRFNGSVSDTKALEGLFGCLGAIFFVIFTTAFASIANGLALVQLWAWFVVTTFNAQPLQLAPAIGLSMVVAHVAKDMPNTEQTAEQKKDPVKTILTFFLKVGLRPLLAVLIGWIVFQFMPQ